jgi:hypothetical protein
MCSTLSIDLLDESTQGSQMDAGADDGGITLCGCVLTLYPTTLAVLGPDAQGAWPGNYLGVFGRSIGPGASGGVSIGRGCILVLWITKATKEWVVLNKVVCWQSLWDG